MTVPFDPDHTMLVVVHPHNRECCSRTGLGTPETEAAVDRIAQVVPQFRNSGIPVRIVFAAHAGADPRAAFGGIHPKIAALIREGDITYQEYDASVYAARRFREAIKADRPRHHILAGFNLSDCVGKSAMMARSDKELSNIKSVSIMSDAAADRSDIAQLELYNDCGVGESLLGAILRHLGVERLRSQAICARLGIGMP